jgi:hypothetical protein
MPRQVWRSSGGRDPGLWQRIVGLAACGYAEHAFGRSEAVAGQHSAPTCPGAQPAESGVCADGVPLGGAGGTGGTGGSGKDAGGPGQGLSGPPASQPAAARGADDEAAGFVTALVAAEALLERAAHCLLAVGTDSSADLLRHLRSAAAGQALTLKVCRRGTGRVWEVPCRAFTRARWDWQAGRP